MGIRWLDKRRQCRRILNISRTSKPNSTPGSSNARVLLRDLRRVRNLHRLRRIRNLRRTKTNLIDNEVSSTRLNLPVLGKRTGVFLPAKKAVGWAAALHYWQVPGNHGN